MDYETARNFVIAQAQPSDPSTILARLQAGQPPVAGHLTSALLALKMVYAALAGTPSLSRELAAALHRLAFESRAAYEAGRRSGVDWPLLLDEDLTRIARGVDSIFSGVWQE